MSKKKILIIGVHDMTSLQIQRVTEEYGHDVEIVSPEQAKEQGLTGSDFANTTFEYKARPSLDTMLSGGTPSKSGQENRRNRRKQKRNKKKRR
jgi:hypothetical protein